MSTVNTPEVTKVTKGTGKPWYIIEKQDNDVLNLFRIGIGVLAVPSVILNLFL